MIHRRFDRSLLFLILLTLSTSVTFAATGYFREPTLRGDTLVFAAEGDLWRVSKTGGTAIRLTTHLAIERSPAISPDGKLLAFSAHYEGPGEAYVMPLDGGLPRRLTWDGAGATVVGWSPDGRVLFSSMRESTLPTPRLFLIDVEGRSLEPVPLDDVSEGCYGADGRTLFFTRFQQQGSQTKRYRGGLAQSLWRFAPGDAEARPLTADYDGTSRSPRCVAGRVYFLSDRDGTMNLWSMDERGGDMRQHTHHVGWEIRGVAVDGGRAIYQLGADLWSLDLASGTEGPLAIDLPSDFDQTREHWVTHPADYVSASAISPDGDRVALTARGRAFVLPVGAGRRIEIPAPEGVRLRRAVFADEGKNLVALSDATGEVELWRYPADGTGSGTALTHDGEILRWEAKPSPDGKRIAHTDKKQRLWITDVASGKSSEIARSENGDIVDLAWSPDSRFLAYARPEENDFTRLYIWSVDTGNPTGVTSDRYDSTSPAWSRDGKFLYFLSDRHLASLVESVWGDREPEPFLGSPTQIFALTLAADARFPFLPDDELTRAGEKTKGEAEKEKNPEKAKTAAVSSSKEKSAKAEGSAEEKKAPRVEIAWEGLAERLYRVPVDSGQYSSLRIAEKHLLLLSTPLEADAKPNLVAVEMRSKKPAIDPVLAGVADFDLSADGKKLLAHKGDDFLVFDANGKGPDKADESKVDLAGWRFPIDPREEWRQMLVEAWRLHRDYFYDPGMHGADWKAVLAKYRPLGERIRTRADLADVLAQMSSELSALHHFVRGGDLRKGEIDIEPASLGATLARDEKAGGFRVTRIARTDPEVPDALAPLARPQSRVAEGETIVSVDGRAALGVADPGELLRDKAGRQVLLGVRDARGIERKVVVQPISPDDDYDLRYSEWEYTRRLAVEKAAAGSIGYLHMRAMGGGNFEEFARDFYPAVKRQGLIVDVRHNRGGNIDSWVLSRLMRKAWAFWKPRDGRLGWENMQQAFRGHMIALVDEGTSSDGELFAEGFRRLGLGPVLGRRTWGGEIWLSANNFLVDKGIATSAEYGVYGPDGAWLIEGHGVDPDIVVENLPHATWTGVDAQLDAAIDYLKKKIAVDPRPMPQAASYPKKADAPGRPNSPVDPSKSTPP